MNPHQMHCRLCYVKIEYGNNLFRKKKLNYASDILEFLKIQLREKTEWPSNACTECIEFIGKMKQFKETVSSTQELLLAPKEKEEPLDEATFEDHFGDNESFGKIEAEEEIELPPEKPIRKMTRSRKPRELDPDTVVSYEDSDDDRQVRRMERKARIQEELDRPFGEAPVKKVKGGRWPAKKAEVSVIKKSKVDLKFEAGALLDHKLRALDMLNCHLCEKKQDSFKEMCNHMRKEHKIPRNHGYAFCCNNRFNIYCVYQHADYHENNDLFKCETCNKRCFSSYHLRKHSQKHKPADALCKHRCSKCDLGFHIKADRNKHERKHDIYKFDCEQCKGMFLTHEQLQDHINFEHENIPRHICDICGKGYKTALSLQGHIKQHSVAKTVEPCDICGLFFADLKMHQKRRHSKEDHLACPDCGKTYGPVYMRRHRLMVHGGPKTLKLDCTVCGREFNNKDKLKVHMDIHLGIRFNCHFCSETYGSSSNRLKHMQRKHAVEYANYKVEFNHKWATKYSMVGTSSLAVVTTDGCG